HPHPGWGAVPPPSTATLAARRLRGRHASAPIVGEVAAAALAARCALARPRLGGETGSARAWAPRARSGVRDRSPTASLSERKHHDAGEHERRSRGAREPDLFRKEPAREQRRDHDRRRTHREHWRSRPAPERKQPERERAEIRDGGGPHPAL